ncbi:MAG: cobalamin biosynthesis protein [Nocardioides sp.]|uniref:cobalamin biosynthesis protein n=1 Tax=Nocardioides sp. TaxID=35761 RepID=UPI0039E606D2
MRASGLVLGYLADRLLGDPSSFHPVAGFGKLAAACERAWYADSRGRGVVHAAALAGGAFISGCALERVARRLPGGSTALTAVTCWAVLGGRSLEKEALAVHALLAAGDLAGARQRLTHLVGRDTSALDEAEIARAAIESVAENTSDAVVAPLLWGALAGPAGMVAYRATNTLDAMVGHRSDRYRQFGWASARLDDLLNLPAARLSGGLVMLAAPSRAEAARRAWRRDAGAHPSPNAGVAEAAFAGSLDLRLGGTNDYGGVVEHRAILGSGPPPVSDDIIRAVRLAGRVGWLAMTAAVALAGARRPGRPRPAGPHSRPPSCAGPGSRG